MTANQPADTRMMGVVHSALRRDLVRARIVLAGDQPDDSRRIALAEHLGWLMDFLHAHHTGEDEGLYPFLLAKDPSTAGILEEMDAEHRDVEPAMIRLRAAARELAEGPDGTASVLQALDELERVLLPHLAREETDLMPLVAAALSQAEWRELDQQNNIRSKSARQLAFEGHWIIDGADDEGYRLVTRLVPPVPRFVLVHFLGGAYRRTARALWSGTDASGVGSQACELRGGAA